MSGIANKMGARSGVVGTTVGSAEPSTEYLVIEHSDTGSYTNIHSSGHIHQIYMVKVAKIVFIQFYFELYYPEVAEGFENDSYNLVDITESGWAPETAAGLGLALSSTFKLHPGQGKQGDAFGTTSIFEVSGNARIYGRYTWQPGAGDHHFHIHSGGFYTVP